MAERSLAKISQSEDLVYLDYAATTPLLPEVRTAMHQAEDLFFANPSALHTPGHLAKESIESVRETLANLIHCRPEELIFTSGSTESNNTVVNIFRDQTIAVAKIEHHSLLRPAAAYSRDFIPLKVDKSGKVCYNEDLWQKNPQLLSISLGNNELGTIQPLADWIMEAHAHGCRVHSDLTQILGKLDLNLETLPLDYATFSAHKIGGPVGVGALFIRKGAPFKPFLLGGSQENHRRAGTLDAVGLAGFKAALDYIKNHDTPKIFRKKIAPLRDRLAREILSKIPGASLNTPLDLAHPEKSSALPNILNVSFAAAEGESIQLYLDAAGIIVSTGSACASGDLQPDHVLMAAHHDPEVAHGSIRFSFGLESSGSDIKRVMSVLPGIIDRLQKISTLPLKKKGV